MHALLPGKFLLALHVYSRDAEIVRFASWKADFASTIMWPINLFSCNPSFIIRKPLLDQRNKSVIEAIARTIFGIQTGLKIFSRGAVLPEYEIKRLRQRILQIFDFCEEFSSTINELLLVWVN